MLDFFDFLDYVNNSKLLGKRSFFKTYCSFWMNVPFGFTTFLVYL